MISSETIEQERVIYARLAESNAIEMAHIDEICTQAAAVPALVKALKDLRSAICDFNGHGMPGFRDRATAYVVIGAADQLLDEMARR